LIITRATEYTLRAVLHMAARYPDATVAKADICEKEEITPAFLTKILQPLIREGLVRSTRGPTGGFSLARPPEELTLLDVLNAVEEPLSLNVCILDKANCERSDVCVLHNLWAEAKGKIDEVFSRRTLRELLDEQASSRPS
jgi:Rrf2 family protein